MKSFLIILFTFIFVANVSGQKKKQEDLKTIRERATGCPGNQAILNAAHNISPETRLIFLISQLGKNENKQNLHWQRLNNATGYYKYQWKRPENSVVTAISKSVKGLGRIGVYADSVLVGFLIANRNDPLSLECY